MEAFLLLVFMDFKDLEKGMLCDDHYEGCIEYVVKQSLLKENTPLDLNRKLCNDAFHECTKRVYGETK